MARINSITVVAFRDEFEKISVSREWVHRLVSRGMKNSDPTHTAEFSRRMGNLKSRLFYGGRGTSSTMENASLASYMSKGKGGSYG